MDTVAPVHEKILPFYDIHEAKVEAIFKCCGRVDPPDDTQLGSQAIAHRVTRTASPWTNGFIERFHWTLQDEFLAKAFSERWYDSIAASVRLKQPSGSVVKQRFKVRQPRLQLTREHLGQCIKDDDRVGLGVASGHRANASQNTLVHQVQIIIGRKQPF